MRRRHPCLPCRFRGLDRRRGGGRCNRPTEGCLCSIQQLAHFCRGGDACGKLRACPARRFRLALTHWGARLEEQTDDLGVVLRYGAHERRAAVGVARREV